MNNTPDGGREPGSKSSETAGAHTRPSPEISSGPSEPTLFTPYTWPQSPPTQKPPITDSPDTSSTAPGKRQQSPPAAPQSVDPRSSRRKKRTFIGAAVFGFVVLIGGVTTWLVLPSASNNPAGPTAAPASTQPSAAPVNSSPSPAGESPETARLYGVLPAGYNRTICTPVVPPASDATATVDCGRNTLPGGPESARYSLFPNTDILARHFQQNIGSDSLTPCPGGGGSSNTWHYDATPNQTAGSVACGTYQGTSELTWTNDAKLMLGVATGPNIDDMHAWWSKYG